MHVDLAHLIDLSFPSQHNCEYQSNASEEKKEMSMLTFSNVGGNNGKKCYKVAHKTELWLFRFSSNY